jgi:hypothetical protein
VRTFTVRNWHAIRSTARDYRHWYIAGNDAAADRLLCEFAAVYGFNGTRAEIVASDNAHCLACYMADMTDAQCTANTRSELDHYERHYMTARA